MNTPNTPEQNDSMSILERRLAEIAARKSQQAEQSSSAEQPASAAPAAAPSPSAATVAPSAEALAAAATTPAAETAAVEPHEAQSSVSAAADVLTQPASEPVAEAAPAPEAAAESTESAPAAVETESSPSASEDITPTGTVAPSAMEMPSQAAASTITEAMSEVMAPAPVEAAAPAEAEAVSEGATTAAADDAAEAAEDDAAEDTAAAPVEFDNFESLDAGQMSLLLLAAIQRPEGVEQAKSLIDRKRQYDARYEHERQEALTRFVAAGGDPAAFDNSHTAEHRSLEKGWQAFREMRGQRRRQEEQQQTQNLERKRQLLDQIRQLLDSSSEQSSDASAPKIKALQTEWKAVGPVPYKESKELWQTYDALLDRFYSQRNLTFELKDLDRRKNLELKNGLVGRAETLTELAQTNPGQAARDLRGLHEEWKHIGPVPQELREEVWARFTAASDKVHGRRTEEMAGRRATEQEALVRKQALMEQLEAMADFRSERIEDWKTKTDELQSLKQQWDAAGFVPRAQATELNKKFWVLYKKFFAQKGVFFKALDEERTANVKRKEELIQLAETHQDDPDYAATREKYINWQKEWKTIGPVPERLSQKLWNRFRAACNAFFERPNREAEQRQVASAAREAQLNELSAEKNAYLDELAARLSAIDPGTTGTLEEYREILAAWTKFDTDRAQQGGQVPVAPRVEERFFSLLGKYLDIVSIPYSQKQELLFRQQLEQMKGAPDAAQRFARREQDLRRVITEQENEIATLKTNLGFFARSKNADTLRTEYEGRIQEAESRVEHAKQQLKTLRQVAPPLPQRESYGDRDNDRRGGGGGRGGAGGGRPGGGFGGGRR